MTGPQGELGSRGLPGKQGVMGFQGEQGLPGISGKTGVPVSILFSPLGINLLTDESILNVNVL